MKTTLRLSAGLFLFSAQTAFAAPQALPDLYPNAHLKQVGPAQAKNDINACRLAGEDYTSGKERGMLGESARGAARGAAKGALAGAIFNGKAGRGAGAGAAVGGLGSAGKSVRENREGSPEYRQYVEACLEDKGYKVVGWK